MTQEREARISDAIREGRLLEVACEACGGGVLAPTCAGDGRPECDECDEGVNLAIKAGVDRQRFDELIALRDGGDQAVEAARLTGWGSCPACHTLGGACALHGPDSAHARDGAA